MILLIRPQVRVHDGPMGYIALLAAANRLTRRDLDRLGLRFDPDVLRRARCAPAEGVDPALDDYLQRVKIRLSQRTGTWVRRYARCCPQCLEESDRWRVGWEMLFADACPIHGVWLIDVCASCGRCLTWDRRRLSHCDCGQLLAKQVPTECPAAVRRLSRALVAALVGEDTDEQAVTGFADGLELTQLQRLIRFLGTYADPQAGRLPRKVPNLDRLSVSWRLVSLTAEMLDAWPSSLHAVLDRMQKDRAEDGGGRLGGRLGYAYTALYRGFPEAAFAPLREAFEDYIAQHWRGALGRRNRRFPESILQRAAWIPASHACARLSISRRRLVRLVAEGMIAGDTRLGSTGRRFLVVRRDNVERYAFEPDRNVGLLAAARMLGVTKRRMARLLRPLFPDARRIGGAGTAWAIPRALVDALLALVERVDRVTTIDQECVSLAHVMKFWDWNDSAVAGALLAALDGGLTPVGALCGVGGVSALVFRREALAAWHVQRTATDLLTMPETAVEMRVKQEVVYFLARAGLLDSQPIDRGKKHAVAHVSRKAIEAFHGNYVFARDLASLLGRSPRSLILRLSLLGVRPVSGPAIDGCRQALFRRSSSLDQALAQLSVSKA